MLPFKKKVRPWATPLVRERGNDPVCSDNQEAHVVHQKPFSPLKNRNNYRRLSKSDGLQRVKTEVRFSCKYI